MTNCLTDQRLIRIRLEAMSIGEVKTINGLAVCRIDRNTFEIDGENYNVFRSATARLANEVPVYL